MKEIYMNISLLSCISIIFFSSVVYAAQPAVPCVALREARDGASGRRLTDIYSFIGERPGANVRILAYKKIFTYTYPMGWYIGRLFLDQIHDTTPSLEVPYIVIEEIGNENMDNFRPLEEFSHWAYLPDDPNS